MIIFALTAHAQRHLGLQFEKRMTRKTYVARVWGVPAEKAGTVDLPLIVDWPNRPRQMVCHQTGKPAQTDWRVLKTDGETARVRLNPRTGRSHQLRVHMQALGHPILGDSFYATGPARDFPRLMLHSEELRFAGSWDWNVVLGSLPYALGVTGVIFGKHIDKIEVDLAKKVHTLPVVIGEKALQAHPPHDLGYTVCAKQFALFQYDTFKTVV